MLFNYQHTKDDIKRILLAGFSACGGSLQRHNSSPPQCDPTQRAFYIIGNSNGIFYYTKKAGCLKTANLLGSFFPILSPLTYNKYRNPRIYIK